MFSKLYYVCGCVGVSACAATTFISSIIDVYYSYHYMNSFIKNVSLTKHASFLFTCLNCAMSSMQVKNKNFEDNVLKITYSSRRIFTSEDTFTYLFPLSNLDGFKLSNYINSIFQPVRIFKKSKCFPISLSGYIPSQYMWHHKTVIQF